MVIAFVLMVVSGLMLLESVNVPLFGSFRRMGTFLVVLAEWWFLGKVSSFLVNLTVFAMVVFAVVAGWGDAVMMDFYGINLLFWNCAFLAWYLVLVSKAGKDTQLNTFGQMYYCNIGALPIVVICMLLNGEFSKFMEHPSIYDVGFQFSFFMTSVQAMILNYTIFWCTQANSPLTTNIVGQIKNVAVSIISILIFNDFTATFTNVSGLVLGTVASAVYAYAKYLEQLPAASKDKVSV